MPALRAWPAGSFVMRMSKGYVDTDYLDRTAERLSVVKQRTYSHLRLAAGHRVLDVACGVGLDTIAMASMMGPSGRIIGVDHDAAMVAEAQRRAAAAGCSRWVTHQTADAVLLPFDDESFDGVRCERLFQHLRSPDAVLAEIARVTKPGGRVVVADTDWGTLSLHSREANIERRLAQCNAERCYNNGYSGRSLPGFFKQRDDLADVTIEAFSEFIDDYRFARQILVLDQVEEEALRSQVITPDELDRWRADLQDLDERGAFFASIIAVVVLARKIRRPSME
ncbi:MAG: methyltransferase domain-containing protein [Actinomycetota bacterium]